MKEQQDRRRERAGRRIIEGMPAAVAQIKRERIRRARLLAAFAKGGATNGG